MNTQIAPIAKPEPVLPASHVPEYPAAGAPDLPPGFTKARSLDAISTDAHRSLKNEVVNILTAAQRHGVPALCVGEIADQFQINTGQFKPPSSFSSAISGLRSAKLITYAGERFFSKSEKMQNAWALVPQQTRLAR